MAGMYWERNGAEQSKYDELIRAVQEGDWTFSQKNENVFHSYYRYFNDGDLPGWARGDRRLYTVKAVGVRGVWWEKVLTEKGLELQEQRVTEAILREYKRFVKRNAR